MSKSFQSSDLSEFLPQEPSQEIDNRRHISALDRLRGIAALMVIVFHLWQFGFLRDLPLPAGILKISVFGQTGVDLFFVLSGFLISRILLSTKDSTNYFRTFYARRALRIFPLYYFALVLYYFVIPFFSHNYVSAGDQWWYWVYLQNIPDTFTNLSADGPGHFWSLAVEEHFYMLWPIVIYFFTRKQIGYISIGVIFTAFLSRLYLISQGIGVFYFTLCRMDALAMGCLLAIVEPWFRAKESRINLLRWTGSFILAILIPLWSMSSGNGVYIVALTKFTIISVFYACLIGIVSFSRQLKFFQFLEYGPLKQCGTIGYGLYVYHGLCFVLIKNLIPGTNSLVQTGIVLTITFLSAYASYIWLERPLLGFKKYFRYAKAVPMEGNRAT
jgi:peptidoglycan/LPS O-acetylase OafA/YrhL